ncbi:MAG: hypothetical protein AB7F59_03000 [Bdellovibrionales bacterium]
MKTLNLHGLLLFCILSVACSPKSFTPVSTLACEGCQGSNDSNKEETPPITFAEQDLEGAADGGANDKAILIHFNKTTKMFQIKIPIAGLNLSIDTTIPQIPDSHVEVVMEDISGNGVFIPVLLVEIPGVYVLGKLGFDPGQLGLDPTRLPNGDLIPPMPGGEGPAISFLIPNINHVVRLYLGINVIGVFIEAGFVPTLPVVTQITFPIKNKSRNEVIGYTSLISKKVPFNGGFFVSLVMPRQIAGDLDDFLAKFITTAN